MEEGVHEYINNININNDILYSIYPQIEDSNHLDFVETGVVMKINAVMKMVEQSVTVIQICVIMSLLSVL